MVMRAALGGGGGTGGGAGGGTGGGAGGGSGARAARPGPSLPIWCRYRAGAVKALHRPAPRDRDTPREARRGLNAILRAARRLGVGAEDLGHLHGAQLLMAASSRGRKARASATETRDPRSSALNIIVAILGAVLAGVIAAMLAADPDHGVDLYSNKSMGGLKQPHADGDLQPLQPEGDIPAYLLEALQSHRNHQHHEDDFILGYHDDYRERYDGFDHPPPFRQSRPRGTPTATPAPAPAIAELPARDMEISEEEAFATRVFVTTPRRQR